MFADYRVPQALLALGALDYSAELMDYLKHGSGTLSSGDEREVEIRGCSIDCVERIRVEMKKLGYSCNSIVLDFFLWYVSHGNLL